VRPPRDATRGPDRGPQAPPARTRPIASPPARPARTWAIASPAAPLARTLAVARAATGRLGLATLLGACATAAAIGLIATSAWLISRSSQRPQESAVAVAIVGVQFFALARGLCRYGERLVGHDAAFRVLRDLRVRVYERLERLAPVGLPAFRSGDLLARLVHDVDSLQDLLLRVLPPFAIAAIVGLGTVALVWWMLPAAGLIVLVALALAASVVPWLTGVLAARAETRQAAVRAQLTATVVDLVEGAPELAVNGATAAQLSDALAADAELTRIAGAGARTAGIGQGVTSACVGLAMWGSLAVGVAAVRAGRLDGVLLAGLALIPLVAFELVTGLPGATQTLQKVRRSASRVQEVVDTQPPVREPAHPREPALGPHRLRVRDLGCSYPGQARRALAHLDLDLGPGRRVALVGASGAGKSTLAAVLLRFLEYQSGSVALDGVEITQLDGDSYRRVIGLVAQDAHIFDSTLAENLRLARRAASDDQLRAVLAKVRLLEWVQGLPLGLDTEVGEHGERMSGGQRQRLAIARTLLADFPLLVLDEPGEHLDVATADAIVADLLAVADDRGVLLITHRLASLAEVDEVLVLERGEVRERGTHAELLGAGGRYACMWQREQEPGGV
jgi:thiol reductant ABC exporter CydC subunit